MQRKIILGFTGLSRCHWTFLSVVVIVVVVVAAAAAAAVVVVFVSIMLCEYFVGLLLWKSRLYTGLIC